MKTADPLAALQKALSSGLLPCPSYHKADGSTCTIHQSEFIAVPSSPTDLLIFERTAPTRFRAKKGSGPSYGLDSICLILERRDDSYTEYLQEARRSGMPLVTLVDRKELLEKLLNPSADFASSASWDQSVELPKVRSAFTESLMEEVVEDQAGASGDASAAAAGNYLAGTFPLYPPNELQRVPSGDLSLIIKIATEAFESLGPKQPPPPPSAQSQKASTSKPTTSILEDLASRKSAKRAPSKDSLLANPSSGSISKKPFVLIVPSTPGATALVTLYNFARFLGCANAAEAFYEERPANASKPSVIAMVNPLTGSRYEVIDNPVIRLGPHSEDWTRVRGVILSGQAWQFRDWAPIHQPKNSPGGGSAGEEDPRDFLRSLSAAVFFHWQDETQRDWQSRCSQSIASWSLTPIAISRVQRHQDSAVHRRFWQLFP